MCKRKCKLIYLCVQFWTCTKFSTTTLQSIKSLRLVKPVQPTIFHHQLIWNITGFATNVPFRGVLRIKHVCYILLNNILARGIHTKQCIKQPRLIRNNQLFVATLHWSRMKHNLKRTHGNGHLRHFSRRFIKGDTGVPERFIGFVLSSADGPRSLVFRPFGVKFQGLDWEGCCKLGELPFLP